MGLKMIGHDEIGCAVRHIHTKKSEKAHLTLRLDTLF